MAGAGSKRAGAGTGDPALMSPERLTPHLIGVGHAMSHPSCIMHHAPATRFIVLGPLLLGS